eukprot:3296221-Pleurochrysis_carterae.AAC.1
MHSHERFGIQFRVLGSSSPQQTRLTAQRTAAGATAPRQPRSARQRPAPRAPFAGGVGPQHHEANAKFVRKTERSSMAREKIRCALSDRCSQEL